MWSLMAAPLFFSGDMSRLDPFTLNILCNSEVIDIDQDALGKEARVVRKNAAEFILAKPLEEGGLAVGLFNLTPNKKALTVSWSDLGLRAPERVRDVWRQKDVGVQVDGITSAINPHGVALFRLMPAP